MVWPLNVYYSLTPNRGGLAWTPPHVDGGTFRQNAQIALGQLKKKLIFGGGLTMVGGGLYHLLVNGGRAPGTFRVE